MFTRYKTDEKGRMSVVAHVYTSREHNIHTSQIDRDCLWAVSRLWHKGYKAYIVGGAVRDLLLGKRPKDFDIATSASPRQVQAVFWNSRPVGKRFRIVHLYFAGSKVIEVTTFRSDEENFEGGNTNIFGTIEQDSRRRDFSINALYYNPLDGHLIDFNDSMKDIRKRRIRSLIPLSYSFSEDPVRMIRAVKYCCTTGFRLKGDVRRAVKKNSQLIQKVSVSRLTDEVTKILNSGFSHDIFLMLHKYRLLGFMMPTLDVYMKYSAFIDSLQQLDESVRKARSEGEDFPLSDMLCILAGPVIVIDRPEMKAEELAKELFREIKVLIAPMTPPNYEINRAVDRLLAQHGYKKRPAEARKSARRHASAAADPAARSGSRRRKRNIQGARKKQPVSSSPASSAEAHDL